MSCCKTAVEDLQSNHNLISRRGDSDSDFETRSSRILSSNAQSNSTLTSRLRSRDSDIEARSTKIPGPNTNAIAAITSDRPVGFVPTPWWRCCPPGGFGLELAMWSIDPVNDTVQIYVFTKHRHFWFAALCGISTLASTAASFRRLTMEEAGVRNVGKTIWKSISHSAIQGFATPIWKDLMLLEGNIEAPVTGLIAPYGMLLEGQLDITSVLSACLGLLSSTRSIAKIFCDRVDFSEMPEAVRATLPSWKIQLVSWWRILSTLCELSLFAVTSVVMHPILTCSLLVPSWCLTILAHRNRTEPRTNLLEAVVVASAYVATWFNGAYCSLLNLKVRPYCSGMCDHRVDPSEVETNQPAWPVLSAAIFRVSASLVMMIFLDLPRGLFSFGTLARSMGRQKLNEEFVSATLQVGQEALYCGISLGSSVLSLGKVNMQCEITSAPGLSEGATLLRAITFTIVTFTTPLYLIGLFVLLIFHVRFRRGDIDFGIVDALQIKHKEINHWGKEQLRIFAPLEDQDDLSESSTESSSE